MVRTFESGSKMAKRKSDTQADEDETKKTSKPSSTKSSTSNKRPKKASAESLGLDYETFEKTAPSLSLKIYESKKSSSGRSEILELELPKAQHSTGSYGYTSSGKRIMVEVEIDGKKEKVPAIVTVNVTIVGSKQGKASTSAEA